MTVSLFFDPDKDHHHTISKDGATIAFTDCAITGSPRAKHHEDSGLEHVGRCVVDNLCCYSIADLTGDSLQL